MGNDAGHRAPGRRQKLAALVGLAIAAWAGAAGAAEAPVADAENGAALVKRLGCVKCHGEQGISGQPMIPNLIGQKEDYLRKQLFELRRGFLSEAKGLKRQHQVMGFQAGRLGDGQMADIAAYYAKLSCPSEDRTDPGPAPKAVPRCIPCHGQRGVSQRATIPNLAGQNRGYLAGQMWVLRAASPGADSWRQHPILSSQTARLSDEDIEALARYFQNMGCP